MAIGYNKHSSEITPKYKVGDYVEIISTRKGKHTGHRFYIEKKGDLTNFADEDKLIMAYETDIPSSINAGCMCFAPETTLRLINPDCDQPAEETFEEILNNIYNSMAVPKELLGEK